MRKILLATTALAGMVLFSASAQAGMEVTMGGYNDFRAGFFHDGLVTSPRRSNDFQDEFQLEIEAKAKANNGMEYGIVASLWNGIDYNNWTTSTVGADDQDGRGAQNNAIRVHQAYGYVNGAWGQIRTGDEHGASDFGVEAPQTYDWGGQVDGYYDQFLTPSTIFAIKPSYVDQEENNTKISYFTPKFGMNGQKFQAGVSFTPNWYDAGVGVVVAEPSAGTHGSPLGTDNYKNVWEIGGGYDGALPYDISAKAGFVVTTGENIQNRTFGGGNVTTQGLRDFTTWDIGAQLGYKGFTLGGNYTDGGRYNTTNSQTNDQHVWDLGLSYKFDRASIAGSYLSGKGYNNMMGGTANAANGTESNYISNYHAWGIGAGYSLFDGMVTSVDAVFFHQEGTGLAIRAPSGDANTNGHVIILSNRISF